MLYREIIAVCSEIHTKHIDRLCGQNVEFSVLKMAVRTVTANSKMYVFSFFSLTQLITFVLD